MSFLFLIYLLYIQTWTCGCRKHTTCNNQQKLSQHFVYLFPGGQNSKQKSCHRLIFLATPRKRKGVSCDGWVLTNPKFVEKSHFCLNMGIGNILILSQVTAYLIVFLSAFFILIPLSVYKAEFDNHCLLYSTGQWVLSNHTSGSPNEHVLDVNWGDIGLCNFPVFISIVSLPVTLGYIVVLSIELFKNTEPYV